MKVQTKFNVGEEVVTPISDRRGRVIEILIAKRFFNGWNLMEHSVPQIRYHVELYFPHRESRNDTPMYGYYLEDELKQLA